MIVPEKMEYLESCEWERLSTDKKNYCTIAVAFASNGFVLIAKEKRYG